MGDARFLTGLVLGFSIAAPVGPIGVLCISRSLQGGIRQGFATGLGAAAADALYGALAAFGVTAVTGFLVAHQEVLSLVGGGALCGLGLQSLLARPAGDALPPKVMSLSAAFGSTLALTLANPVTILSFAAAFTALRLRAADGYLPAVSMVAGVFSGSCLWWALLSTTVGLLKSHAGDGFARGVGRASGLILLGFGAYAIAAALH